MGSYEIPLGIRKVALEMGVFHRPTALPRWPALFLHCLSKHFPRNLPLFRDTRLQTGSKW